MIIMSKVMLMSVRQRDLLAIMDYHVDTCKRHITLYAFVINQNVDGCQLLPHAMD
jgi:hypothetical protein